MKNAFVISSLILTVGYPAVVTASMLGVIPFAVPSLFQFIGIYTSLGVLAFAFGDYMNRPQPHELDGRAATPQRSPRHARVPAVTIQLRPSLPIGTTFKNA